MDANGKWGQVIGNIVLLYRANPDDPKITLPNPKGTGSPDSSLATKAANDG